MSTILAFDFGMRKIGVAVGNTLVRVAHPLTTIRGEARSSRFEAIGALVAQWQPQSRGHSGLVRRPRRFLFVCLTTY